MLRFAVIFCCLSLFSLFGCSSGVVRNGSSGDIEMSLIDEAPTSKEAYEFAEENANDSTIKTISIKNEPCKSDSGNMPADNYEVSKRVKSTIPPSVYSYRKSSRDYHRNSTLLTRVNYLVLGPDRGAVFDWYTKGFIKNKKIYLRLKKRAYSKSLVSFYAENFSNRIPIGISIGDMCIHFGSGLLASAPYFNYPYSKGYPFFNTDFVIHHSSLYGTFLRGVSVSYRGGALALYTAKGLKRSFGYNGIPRNGEKLGAAFLMFDTGDFRFGPFVMTNIRDYSHYIYSFEAELEKKQLHVATEIVSDGKGSPAFSIKGLGDDGLKSIAFEVAASPANYFTPFGKILGRTISATRFQRGIEMVLRQKIGLGGEVAFNFERYLSGNGERDYRKSLLGAQLTLNHMAFSPLLRFSFERRCNKKAIPFVSFQPQERPESYLKIHGAVISRRSKMSGSRLSADLAYGDHSNGILTSLWTRLSLFKRRLKLNLFILRTFSVKGRPIFYYYAPTFSGMFPWQSIYGEGHAVDLTIQIDVGSLRFSGVFISEGQADNTMGMQIYLKL